MVRRILLLSLFGSLTLCVVAGGLFFLRYQTADVMVIPVEEVSTAQYPEDPAIRSVQYDRYQGRQLRLERKDEDHFDFIFESDRPGVATVALRNIDMSLFVPVKPTWIVDDRDLEVVTVVEREWNRQQARFPRGSRHLEVTGGDGFETAQLATAQLARNCLNAGLFEIMLTTEEGGEERLYYHGWFQFPLGFYWELFEEHNGSSYLSDCFRLEHWVDPEGRQVDLDRLRKVISEQQVAVVDDASGKIVAEGEQKRKLRTLNASNFRSWGDFIAMRNHLGYATFMKPGRYNVAKPWGNDYALMTKLDGAIWRKIRSPSDGATLDEIELTYTGASGEKSRFLVSGFSLDAIPQLEESEYPRGFYMPMGISVPPVTQSYSELERSPPYRSPYFSVLLDEAGGWLNHHRIAIDGVAMRRDPSDSRKLHLYLISYERHSLICHLIVDVLN
jgi:hypothetical protein